jgi:hypothetical protein
MVDRRPQMQRSHRNATVLIFTCLIQRSDGSRMNSLLSAIEYFGFSYKTCTVSSPIVSCAVTSPASCALPFCLPIVENRRCWLLLSYEFISVVDYQGENEGEERKVNQGKFVLLQVRRKSIPFPSFPCGSALIWIRF